MLLVLLFVKQLHHKLDITSFLQSPFSSLMCLNILRERNNNVTNPFFHSNGVSKVNKLSSIMSKGMKLAKVARLFSIGKVK